MKTEMLNNNVVHRYGGNGFVVLQEGIPNHPDSCRVGYVVEEFDKNRNSIWKIAHNQAFLARTDHLKVEQLEVEGKMVDRAINPAAMPTVRAIRAGLDSGDLEIVATHLISTDPAVIS